MSHATLATPAEKKNKSKKPLPGAADFARAAAAIADGSGAGYTLPTTNSVTLSVQNQGQCFLNYTATICGSSDRVGIYTTTSATEGQFYQGNPDAWAHCKYITSGGYNTTITAAEGMMGLYWSWNYAEGAEQWVLVAYTPPLPSNPTDGTKVSSTDQ